MGSTRLSPAFPQSCARSRCDHPPAYYTFDGRVPLCCAHSAQIADTDILVPIAYASPYMAAQLRIVA